jgi:cold shock protein
MSIGKVKLWKTAQGFGFIEKDDGSGDTFVHARTAQAAGFESLAVGQRIEFNIGINPRNNRDHAVDLKLLDPVISTRSLASEDSSGRDEHLAHMQLAETTFMRR